MKLPNSLTGPSNRGDDAPESMPCKAHGCLPGIIVLIWIGYLFKPAFKDAGALALAPFAFISFGTSIGVPPSWIIPVSILMLVTLLVLPWLSLFASSVRTTFWCSIICLLLVLLQMSGCQTMLNGFSKLANHSSSQAQRACVMQPRARRTLDIELSHTSISPNPNGVPSGTTDRESRASKVAISLREMSWTHGKLNGSRVSSVVHGGESFSLISTERDGYSASPNRRGQVFEHALETPPESAGGPAHSRTLPRAFTLPVS